MQSHDALERIEQEIALLFRRAESARTASPKAGSLDRSAYLLLGHLYERGPSGVKTLAEAFHLDVSTVSRQTATLKVKGWAERSPDPTDGRACLLQITPEGTTHLLETKTARHDLYAELLQGWSQDDLEQFSVYLARLNRTLDTWSRHEDAR